MREYHAPRVHAPRVLTLGAVSIAVAGFPQSGSAFGHHSASASSISALTDDAGKKSHDSNPAAWLCGRPRVCEIEIGMTQSDAGRWPKG